MIENYFEFSYLWGTQGMLILLAFGFGMLYDFYKNHTRKTERRKNK